MAFDFSRLYNMPFETICGEEFRRQMFNTPAGSPAETDTDVASEQAHYEELMKLAQGHNCIIMRAVKRYLGRGKFSVTRRDAPCSHGDLRLTWWEPRCPIGEEIVVEFDLFYDNMKQKSVPARLVRRFIEVSCDKIRLEMLRRGMAVRCLNGKHLSNGSPPTKESGHVLMDVRRAMAKGQVEDSCLSH